MSSSRLIDVLEARSGVVCAVGAGGKKTTLYHLASTHPGRVGLTCTVAHSVFPATLGAHVVVAPEDELVPAVVAAAAEHRLVAFALPPQKKARYAGVSRQALARIADEAGFDVLLVKADGARMRWIKAPGEDEPVLPTHIDTLIPLVSARALGQPLSERIAHRPHRIEAITRVGPGEPLEPHHIARWLAHESGALKGAGAATVAPLINMVDDAELLASARKAAWAALAMTDRFDRVALTSTDAPDRLVEVVTR